MLVAASMLPVAGAAPVLGGSGCQQGETVVTFQGMTLCEKVFTASASYSAPALTSIVSIGQGYLFAVLSVGGGGGGGGAGQVTNFPGGGGGGGDVRVCDYPSITYGSTITVTVGAGGSGGSNAGTDGTDGGDSSIDGTCVSNGGKGGEGTSSVSVIGRAGGASGNGNVGGEWWCETYDPTALAAGGGGGSGAAGQDGYEPTYNYDCYGGYGGVGTVPNTEPFADGGVTYGAGGGGAGLCGGGLGGAYDSIQTTPAGNAGTGATFDGCGATPSGPTSASANSGSGGGGAWSGYSVGQTGGDGGSGIVIVRYAPAGPTTTYSSTGFRNVAAPPSVTKVYASREKRLRFQVLEGTTVVTDRTVIDSLGTEDGCVSSVSVRRTGTVQPADYGMGSVRWHRGKQEFSIDWLAPSTQGTTVSAVVTLTDGTRIVACFRTK